MFNLVLKEMTDCFWNTNIQSVQTMFKNFNFPNIVSAKFRTKQLSFIGLFENQKYGNSVRALDEM